MKIVVKYFPIFLVVFLIALVFVVPVLARGPGYQETAPPAAEVTNHVVDLLFLVAITGFFKQQFGLTKPVVFVVAFAIGLVLWFQPEISALNSYLASFLAYVKWFLGALGSFDTTVNIGQKIAGVVE